MYESAEQRLKRSRDKEKNIMIERLLGFFHDRVVGEWIAEQHVHVSYFKVDSLVGRYFTERGEATNWYILLQELYEQKLFRDVKTNTGLCFEEDNPRFLENIVRSAKNEELWIDCASGTITGIHPKEIISRFEAESTVNYSYCYPHQSGNYDISGIAVEKEEYEQVMMSILREKKIIITEVKK